MRERHWPTQYADCDHADDPRVGRGEMVRCTVAGSSTSVSIRAGIGAAGLALTAWVGPALAHEGEPPAPHDLWTAWTAEPTILLSLVLAAWAYGRGGRALWRRAGRGRGVRTWHVAAFASGLVAIFIALVSPLDALSSALLSAHLAQHLLLMLVATPLLVLDAPLVPLLWAAPEPRRRAIGIW